MEMTIEHIIKYLPTPICGDTVIGKEKQKEYDAYDSALIILRKYQKIQEIYQKWNEVNDFSYNKAMRKIGEVIKDGQI